MRKLSFCEIQLKDISASLCELWQIMDSTREEKSCFSRIISLIGLSEAEIVEPAALSLDIIQQVFNLFLSFPPTFYLFSFYWL